MSLLRSAAGILTAVVATVATVAALVATVARADDAAPRRPPPTLAVEHYRLANGLEVVLQPDPTVTTAVVLLRYHVGSKDEAPGRTGFAHLFEHLMFEGSTHVAEGQFDVLLETAGGWNNGSTDVDATTYVEQVPASFLALALYLEADRLAGLWDAMTPTVLATQRDVVGNERKETIETVPYGKAELDVQQALWPDGHGNQHPTIGVAADLAAASMADVERFWRTYYVAGNATLVIVGGIDVAATRALVDRYFAWLPARPRPAVRTVASDGVPAPRPEPARLALTDDVAVAKVIVSWRTPVACSAEDIELELLAQLLGGGRTSRLDRRLVHTDRLASEVYAVHHQQLLGGELQLHAIAATGVTGEQLRAAIATELDRLRTSPPTVAEVERARRTLEAELLSGLENLSSRADQLATWAACAGDPDHLAELLAGYAAATPASLAALADRWLGLDHAVVAIVEPAAGKVAAP